MHTRTKSLFAVVLAIGLAGCSDVLFDDVDKTYDGPPMLEFAPVMPDGTYVQRVTFTAGSTDSETVNVRINYLAAAATSSVEGEVAVGSGTTATDGEHYRLSTTFSIPAGENTTALPVEILGTGLADGESVSLFLELQASAGIQVSPNYATFEIRVTKEEP